MNQNRRFQFLIATVILFLLIGIIFYFVDYIQNEGFNPTDDGVVLAQSYRIINGEIPHKDFISIRPVLSGILHTIHFQSSLPLFESGRVFVLFEIFIISFLWAFILVKHFFRKTEQKYQLYIFSLLGIVAFLLNVNTYHLYPWTTIDAVLFSSIGFTFLLSAIDCDHQKKAFFLYTLAALFLFSLAALCRQSFIFISILSSLFLMVKYFKKINMIRLAFAFILGFSPFLLYFIYLLANDAFPEFISQMTGRTELFETGILRYIKSFILAQLGLLNLIMLVFVAVSFIKQKHLNIKTKSTLTGKFLLFFDKENKSTWRIISGIYSFALIFGAFWFFFHKDYKIIPFEFFWILVTLSIAAFQFRVFGFKETVILTFVILLAWTSSISLGANAPIYTTGILAISILILIIELVGHLNLINFKYLNKQTIKIAATFLVSVLFFISIYGQRQFNYRDLSAGKLNKNLGDILPAFGNIKTNQTTYNYYKDFLKIYQQFDLKDRFVLLPNNAAIYPALQSRSPFPLDWMIRNEHVGADEQLLQMAEKALQQKDLYIVVDKYNSIEMAFTPFEEMKYPKDKFMYMSLIEEYCIEVEIKSEFFNVFQTMNK